jgi:hypothetical protein
MIGAELSKEWRDVDNGQLYEVGRGGGRGFFFWGVGGAKFQCF